VTEVGGGGGRSSKTQQTSTQKVDDEPRCDGTEDGHDDSDNLAHVGPSFCTQSSAASVSCISGFRAYLKSQITLLQERSYYGSYC
jgi:hypothetical protein